MKKKKTMEETEEKFFPSTSAAEAKEAEASAEGEKALPMEEDVALFHELFPALSAEDIPEEVWREVEAGESLAKSYALYAVKEYREQERVRAVNEENAKKAPPAVRHDGGDGDYFSPEAVKGMSPAQVKKHYQAILTSMDSWK
ncbi:MAG: hypothetical protein IJC84_06980 [Clostridia bacterium]|nr:hypothetical protein [Clostridia bacterium]